MKHLVSMFFLFYLSGFVNAQSQSKALFSDANSDVDSLSKIHRHTYTCPSSDKRQLEKEVSPVSFGFRTGMNLSNMNFSKGYPPPVIPVETSWVTGFHLGFNMHVPLYKNVFVQQEYLYSQMGGEIVSSGIAYKLYYISLPVLLEYKLTSQLSFVAGPQFDLLIWAKVYNDGNSLNITHDIEERNISAVAGVEYQLSKRLSISARYIHGLNHVGIEAFSTTKEFKYEQVQLAAELKLYKRYFTNKCLKHR